MVADKQGYILMLIGGRIPARAVDGVIKLNMSKTVKITIIAIATVARIPADYGDHLCNY